LLAGAAQACPRPAWNRVVAAEKEAEANVIRRREEAAATRAPLDTAKVMAERPVMLRLTELKALDAIAGKVKNLAVLNGTESLMKGLMRPSDRADGTRRGHPLRGRPSGTLRWPRRRTAPSPPAETQPPLRHQRLDGVGQVRVLDVERAACTLRSWARRRIWAWVRPGGGSNL